MAKERNSELAGGPVETFHTDMQRKKNKKKNTKNIILKNHVIIGRKRL